MSGNLNKRVLLVGTGNIAIEYAKVLKALDVTFTVIGRGETNAKIFKDKTGVIPSTGGIEKYLETDSQYYTHAIVAVSVDQLKHTTICICKKNIPYILVEKPGGIDFDEVSELYDEHLSYNSEIFIAYNRRFYASVMRSKEIIKEDGGVTSFSFDFTEWSHVVSKLEKPRKVLENWFLANSTHVIDLAFYLGGNPMEFSTFVSGGLDWHPSGSIFAGAGVSVTGALFSYQANWEAPGRWGVEVLTKYHRLILRPLEELHCQRLGSVKIEQVDLNDELDVLYKPGLFRQSQNFLFSENCELLSLTMHLQNLNHYKKIILPDFLVSTYS